MKQLVLAPEAAGLDQIRVDGADFHYLAHVRRLVLGDRIAALAGVSRLVLELAARDAESVTFRVLSSAPSVDEKPALTLFPFLLKAGKLDDVIRQACEAGVTQIVPVEGDHCVSRLSAGDLPHKLERWQAIARQAAQQSGNLALCEVFPPVPSRQVTRWWASRGPLLAFHQTQLAPVSKANLHRYLADDPRHIGLLVGPEGGLSEAEVTALLAEGCLPVWLGPAVLRAETASIHAAAAVNIILQERSEWTINPPTESHV
ncbi:MAG: RsmE family RNA methyltransferase [Spirochaetales bacterium]